MRERKNYKLKENHSKAGNNLSSKERYIMALIELKYK